MNVGMDIGYFATKAVTGGKQVSFESVVGTLDRARFSLDGTDSIAMLEPSEYLVGAGAVTQSRNLDRNESRAWAGSEDWHKLVLAALSELTTASNADLNIVTGLPVKFYGDKDKLAERLAGEHRFRRDGRRGQTLRTASVKVVPQPFGALLDVALDNSGKLVDVVIATKTVGVIDLGGKTCNILSVDKLAEISRESTSVNVGAWDLARKVGDWLANEYPKLELRDHKLMAAIVARQIDYYGNTVDLTPVINDALAPMVKEIVSQAGQLWNGAAHLSRIIVTGGGALLFGEMLAANWPHAQVIPDPVFANAHGFWKLAQRSG